VTSLCAQPPGYVSNRRNPISGRHFGRENDPDVLAAYRWLSAHGIKNKDLWFDRVSSHNIFRAMVVIPYLPKIKPQRWR
jgi:hypothetical protein